MKDLQSTVSFLELLTTVLSIVAAICTLLAFFSALLKRRVAWLERVEIYFGAMAAIAGFIASFTALRYVSKNRQLQEVERTQQLSIEREIANAQAKTALANEKAEQTILGQKQLEHENLKLGARLEKEHRERSQLERGLYPERLFDSETAIHRLKPFAGTGVIVRWRPEEEPTQLASAIAYTLQEAGWRLASVEPGLTSETPMDAGVVGILVRCSPGRKVSPNTAIPSSCDQSVAAAADALVEEIRQNKLRVWRDFRLPVANMIQVMIGQKEEYLRERQLMNVRKQPQARPKPDVR